jgi:hypothetical protein
MVPTTRSEESAALEHILTDILSEPPPPDAASSTSPFHALLAKAGVSSASDFISLEPLDYGILTFAVEPSGPEDQQSLSIIQVKKINFLFSWFHQVPPSTTLLSRLGALYRHWSLMEYLQLLSHCHPLPSMISARVLSAAFLTIKSSRKIASGTPGIGIS